VRVVVRKEPLRRILQWTRRALFAASILLLGYFGFALADAWIFQGRQNQDFDRELRDRHIAASSPPQPAASKSPPRRAPAAAIDGLVGRMEIPRLRLSAVVVEGVGETALRRAVGHIPGTALPGGEGNVGLAAHRDTFFRPLKDLRVNDEIRFTTLTGDFRYEVELITIVEPDNVRVLAPSHDNVLTMVTCYPFSYIGAAPRRFIVRARQVWPQTAMSSIAPAVQ
jgi:sortase A